MFRLLPVNYPAEFGSVVPMHLSHCRKMVSFQRFTFDMKSSFLISQGIQIPSDSDIHALSTLEDVQYATEHGVYIVNKEKVYKTCFS